MSTAAVYCYRIAMQEDSANDDQGSHDQGSHDQGSHDNRREEGASDDMLGQRFTGEVPQEKPNLSRVVSPIPESLKGASLDVSSHGVYPAATGPLSPKQIQATWVPRPVIQKRRRVILPLVLFFTTCISTFWVGFTGWNPVEVWLTTGEAAANHPELYSSRWDLIIPMFQEAENWQRGLIYMGAVLGILLTHEMGHFLVALFYRIPASLPFFLPVPISPFGTMGAVIGMEGHRADRRQMFDIGLAGPLAGLVVAIPVLWFGILQADVFPKQIAVPGQVMHYQDPLMVKWMIQYLRPDLPQGAELRMNALLMAGWVGMLITGLNMMPVSQLDGGHVAYALFGKRAHILARMLLLGAVVFMFVSGTYIWILMVLIVMLIGTDHPPTANDQAELGAKRWVIGFASLIIPILCFPPMGIQIQ